jgi:DNA-binding response OmpR family regulator
MSSEHGTGPLILIEGQPELSGIISILAKKAGVRSEKILIINEPGADLTQNNELSNSKPPKLVIIDLDIFPESGDQVAALQTLREEDSPVNTSAIVGLTSSTNPDHMANLKPYANMIISKPFNPTEFTTAISLFLST